MLGVVLTDIARLSTLAHGDFGLRGHAHANYLAIPAMLGIFSLTRYQQYPICPPFVTYRLVGLPCKIPRTSIVLCRICHCHDLSCLVSYMVCLEISERESGRTYLSMECRINRI